MDIYKLSKTVNVDAGAKCTLQCPMCMRQSPKMHDLSGDWITLDQVKKLAMFYNKFVFCGQISDPMVHPNMVPILEFLNGYRRVEMHTAASQKPEDYWGKCFEANREARWVFGLDGLPSSSHKYRINQDGHKLFDMMLKAKYEYDIRVTWNYIIFDYNEDEMETAKKLANTHGIELAFKKSGRFYSENDKYKPSKGNYIDTRIGYAEAKAKMLGQ